MYFNWLMHRYHKSTRINGPNTPGPEPFRRWRGGQHALHTDAHLLQHTDRLPCFLTNPGADACLHDENLAPQARSSTRRAAPPCCRLFPELLILPSKTLVRHKIRRNGPRRYPHEAGKASRRQRAGSNARGIFCFHSPLASSTVHPQLSPS